MQVNSFFCGAGGFDLGFIQAGFEIAGAWDFDKYAVESYKHGIGDHVQQADVSKMTGADVPNANGWTFGFPCQDISVAGKGRGFIVECIECLEEYEKLIDTHQCPSCGCSSFKAVSRSGMFFEIMRLLDEVDEKPDWILAENVKAVKKLIPVIKDEYEKAGYRLVDPQLYNTKYWFLPQNRERYFLLGVREDNGISKNFTFPKQQTDFIPKLSSILESNVEEKYYIDDLKAAKIIEQAMNRIEPPMIMASRGRYNGEGKVKQNYELNKEGVTNTLTSVQKDNYLIEQPKIEMVGLLDMKGKDQWKRVYNPEGISPTLVCSGGGQHEPKILTEYRIRKLTPREYARLQGFPESYEQIVSNSQFYKQMGNAVTVTVSHAIAKAIKEQFYGA